MNLPERQVQEHNYDQEHFLRRLATYRESNMEDNTVINYFEELDINPLYLGNPWSRTTSCVWEGLISWLVCSAFSTLTLSSHPARDHQQQWTWLPAADTEDLPHGGPAQELRTQHPGDGERAEEEGWGEDEERGHAAGWGGEQGGRGGQAKGCTLGGVGTYWEESWDLDVVWSRIVGASPSNHYQAHLLCSLRSTRDKTLSNGRPPVQCLQLTQREVWAGCNISHHTELDCSQGASAWNQIRSCVPLCRGIMPLLKHPVHQPWLTHAKLTVQHTTEAWHARQLAYQGALLHCRVLDSCKSPTSRHLRSRRLERAANWTAFTSFSGSIFW